MSRLALSLAAIAVLGLGAMPAPAAEKSAARQLIAEKCSTCHGDRGQSVSVPFPHLAGQQAEYMETQLKAFRDKTRADPHAQQYMWRIANQLTDDIIKELAAFFAAQRPAEGQSAGHEEVAAGQQIYDQGIAAQEVPACQSCHGDKAQGNGAFPRLAGQRRSYLEKQLEAFAANLRANEVMHENSKNLTALQISQVAAFLSAQ